MSGHWSRGWRAGPQRWDWLRSIRCAVTGHRWAVNAHNTQRCCGRCWMVQNRSTSGSVRMSGRGMFYAVAFSLPFWLLVAAVVWWVAS